MLNSPQNRIPEKQDTWIEPLETRLHCDKQCYTQKQTRTSVAKPPAVHQRWNAWRRCKEWKEWWRKGRERGAKQRRGKNGKVAQTHLLITLLFLPRKSKTTDRRGRLEGSGWWARDRANASSVTPHYGEAKSADQTTRTLSKKKTHYNICGGMRGERLMSLLSRPQLHFPLHSHAFITATKLVSQIITSQAWEAKCVRCVTAGVSAPLRNTPSSAESMCKACV